MTQPSISMIQNQRAVNGQTVVFENQSLQNFEQGCKTNEQPLMG